MELKDYQKEVLDELNAFFGYLEKYQKPIRGILRK